ncbi:hypothetical protein GUJ93_ZPchr0010g10245 [Zizania palustris]|uniref:AT-hook motif nuclear-localized protein n=1 Tax=Zizania palustris TaxID=103762 RepID=A0A8J6BBW5_ZIZPA|nr:hypothetical protein GUJ93_ZPchr0010g10245 [Zizania palustris]
MLATEWTLQPSNAGNQGSCGGRKLVWGKGRSGQVALRLHPKALGGTRGDGGAVVLGVGGGINIVGTGGDTSGDNIGAGNDDVGSPVLEVGADVIRASDAAGGILTSTGTVATCQVLHDNVLTTAHDDIPSSGGEVVLLRDGGFEWPVGGTLGTRTLNTNTSSNGSRGKHLATDDNLDGGGLGYDASALGGGGPGGKSSCGLGQEGLGDGSGIPRRLSGDCDAGRFEIISLSGSFLLAEDGDMRSRTGGLSVALAGSDGRVLGGCVAGMLMAATPVQVVVASFIAEGKKSKPAEARKVEPMSAPPQMATYVPAPVASPPSEGTSSGSFDDSGSPINHTGMPYNHSGRQQQQQPMPPAYASGGWSLSAHHQNRHDSDMKMMSN